MRFGPLALAEAEGAILAHTLRAGASVLKKGRRLDRADLALLAAAGLDRVIAARLDDDDAGEDEVAAAVARALAGPEVRVAPARTGRANLHAEVAGLWRVDAARIDALNAVDEGVTVATLAPLSPVAPREMVATVKVIPFAVPRATLAACLAALGPGPAAEVVPFRARRAGLVLTRLPGQPEARLDQGARAVGERLRALGVTLVRELRCAHDVAALAGALRELTALAVDLVLVLGASAIVDRHDVVPAAIGAIGGVIDHFGMPVDPGNLILLASGAACTFIGVPSCARSPKRSGFDLVLERVVAGLPCGPAEVKQMGVGGLLPDIPSRPGPRDERPPDRPRAIAGLVLAAGSSRRMGPVNKLLVPIEGRPMVARVVDGLAAAGLSEIVVVTGHEAHAVRAALGDRAVRFVHNEDHLEGLASSLRTGVRALGPDADGVLVCLGDMPWVRAETLAALAAALDPDEGLTIAVPMFEGKRGNPVLWGRRHLPEILGLTGDAGARELIARHRDEVALVHVDDPGVLLDVDTQDALERLVPPG